MMRSRKEPFTFLKRMMTAVILFILLQASAAAAAAVNVTGCRYTDSTHLVVTASAADVSKIPGRQCCLLELPFTGGVPDFVGPGVKPLAAAGKSRSMTFTVKVKASRRARYLYSRFAVAVPAGNGYQLISNARYLSNPGSMAEGQYVFPRASSKKGLQIKSQMVTDAVELNVQNAAINIVLSDIPAGKGEKNKSRSYAYKYNGKKYWFRKSVIGSYDRQLKGMSETNAVISAILLLGWRSDLKYMIPPAGRHGGHNFYAWNVADPEARQMFSAILSFLAKRYSGAAGSKGRIVNWIVGNEVADYKSWNYGGTMSLEQYASLYADAFRLTYMAAASGYSGARVYISLDHLWNSSQNGGFTGRNMLDAFVSALRAGGYIPWNLAYHPYSSPLHETRFWKNGDGQATAALTTPVITMRNLNVLTGYIKSRYGPGVRVILSEQGYTSVRGKVQEENVQSAAIAYSYLLTEANDMVDSFIMNRHVDHIAETSAGLYLGLWTNSRDEWADRKKQSWNTFKYMDTNLSEAVTTSGLGVIGAASWKQLIPGYSPSLYTRNYITQGRLQVVGSYKKKVSIPKKWKKYGGASSFKKKKKTLTVKRTGGNNRNIQWGITQTFKKGLNLNGRALFTTVRIKGAKSGAARIRMRIYSGAARFECFCDIPCGKDVRLGTSLAGWPGASNITRIQIVAEPVSKGWKKGASMKIKVPVAG